MLGSWRQGLSKGWIVPVIPARCVGMQRVGRWLHVGRTVQRCMPFALGLALRARNFLVGVVGGMLEEVD